MFFTCVYVGGCSHVCTNEHLHMCMRKPGVNIHAVVQELSILMLQKLLWGPWALN